MRRWQKIQERQSVVPEALDATKEALVHIMNKYSIDSTVMVEIALAVGNAIKIQKTNGTEKEMILELRKVAMNVVKHKLAERHMNTPDITQAFEEKLDERLPSQFPED